MGDPRPQPANGVRLACCRYKADVWLSMEQRGECDRASRVVLCEECESADDGARQVVERPLQRGADAADVGVDALADQHAARVLRPEALLEQARPHAAQRSVLRDFFEERVVRVEDPRDAAGDVVNVGATFQAPSRRS